MCGHGAFAAHEIVQMLLGKLVNISTCHGEKEKSNIGAANLRRWVKNMRIGMHQNLGAS